MKRLALLLALLAAGPALGQDDLAGGPVDPGYVDYPSVTTAAQTGWGVSIPQPLGAGIFQYGTVYPQVFRCIVAPHTTPVGDQGREFTDREYDRCELDGAARKFDQPDVVSIAVSHRIDCPAAALVSGFNVVDQIHTSAGSGSDPLWSHQVTADCKLKTQYKYGLAGAATVVNAYTTPGSVDGLWLDIVSEFKLDASGGAYVKEWQRLWPAQTAFTQVINATSTSLGYTDDPRPYMKIGGLYRNTPYAAQGTGSINGNVLTVSAKSAGTIAAGNEVVRYGAGPVTWTLSGVHIAAQLTGTAGGVGTYSLDAAAADLASGALVFIPPGEIITVETANLHVTRNNSLQSLLTCAGCWSHPK